MKPLKTTITGEKRRFPAMPRRRLVTPIFLAVALLTGVLSTVHTAAAPEPAEAAVSPIIQTCESWNWGSNYCYWAADPVVDVILDEQLSSSPCVEGATYGHDSTGIWVRGGCRGRFEISESYEMEDVTCQSWNYATKRCGVTSKVRDVRLLKQYSRSTCATNSSNVAWSTRTLAVTGGCRGKFRVYSR